MSANTALSATTKCLSAERRFSRVFVFLVVATVRLQDDGELRVLVCGFFYRVGE